MHCENGMSRPSDIAFHLGIAPASVTYLLWKFIDKEYCTREIDESDVGVSYLKITEHGSAILKWRNAKVLKCFEAFSTH